MPGQFTKQQNIYLTSLQHDSVRHFQGYVETRDPRRLYRVYCQLEDVVYTINEEKEVSPPDYETVVTADLNDLPNYEQAVQQHL